MNSKMERLIKSVVGVYKDIFKYIYIPPIGYKPLLDSEDSWYMSSKIIPHAMGGIDGCAYTNSKEALERTLKNKFEIVEADVNLTLDGIPVLSHELCDTTLEEFMTHKIDDKYTPLSLKDLACYMEENEKLYVLLDIKDNFQTIIQYIKNNLINLADRFIIQVSTRKTYKLINKIYQFKYYHFNFSVDGNLNYNLKFLIENNIHTCSIVPKMIKKKSKLKYLKKYNIKPYAYTINSKEEYEKLLNLGVHGIFTDKIYN